jgi:hypothetical protein
MMGTILTTIRRLSIFTGALSLFYLGIKNWGSDTRYSLRIAVLVAADRRARRRRSPGSTFLVFRRE